MQCAILIGPLCFKHEWQFAVAFMAVWALTPVLFLKWHNTRRRNRDERKGN
jgi:hypothetical protein